MTEPAAHALRLQIPRGRDQRPGSEPVTHERVKRRAAGSQMRQVELAALRSGDDEGSGTGALDLG